MGRGWWVGCEVSEGERWAGKGEERVRSRYIGAVENTYWSATLPRETRWPRQFHPRCLEWRLGDISRLRPSPGWTDTPSWRSRCHRQSPTLVTGRTPFRVTQKQNTSGYCECCVTHVKTAVPSAPKKVRMFVTTNAGFRPHASPRYPIVSWPAEKKKLASHRTTRITQHDVITHHSTLTKIQSTSP